VVATVTYPTHPKLPAGINSSSFNGDAFNGAGFNEPIWPMLFDTFEPFVPLIITPPMLAVFDGCADITIAAEPNEITFPQEVREIIIRKGR
jgi:hypothetical protein